VQPVTADGVQPYLLDNHWYLIVWCLASGIIRVLHSLSRCCEPAAILGAARQLLHVYMPRPSTPTR